MFDSMKDLETACKACNRCELAKTRTHVVVGTGDIHAEVMFIGEGPGQQEDLQGLPFVGRAGQLLDKMLLAVGIERSMVYIANTVKCRPPQNRDPLPEEQAACLDWLTEQIRLINPKIIVCLGRISAMRFIDPAFKITQQHGQFFEQNGRLYTAFLHPAALLRNPNQKPIAFQDFIDLRAKINEICEMKIPL